MQINSDFRDLLHALVDAGARFLIVGAYAVIQYTEPRYTKDLDLWVEPTRRNAARVRRALTAFGAPVLNLAVEDLCDPTTVFQIGVAPVRVDLLTSVTGLDFGTAYKRATTTTYGDVPVRILSLEDTIRAKRAAGRLQDRLDVRKLERALQRRPMSTGRRERR